MSEKKTAFKSLGVGTPMTANETADLQQLIPEKYCDSCIVQSEFHKNWECMCVCVCVYAHIHTHCKMGYLDVSPGVGMRHLEVPKNPDGLNLGIHIFVF